ncbi:MAG: hypothetical protein LBL82_08200 [Oscillospiraceae bacterium]|jgi:energy-coupling factor transport system substrate-specific component|nr:hypothetical protein [Oscillospiraceae bacterium]
MSNSVRIDINRRTQRVALIGMLCAVAVVGRIGMTFLPNVQPVTAILILTAVFVGVLDSLCSAVVIVVATNLYMGMGMWTFTQISAWSVIVLISWLIFRKKHNRYLLLAWSLLCGYLYGAAISTVSYNIMSMGGANQGYVLYWLSGLPLDTYHALGNAVFVWFLYPLFSRFIGRGDRGGGKTKFGE